LDIGCGSGIATLELAKCFPSAQVVGVDLAPVVELESLPPNVSFIQGAFTDLVETGVLKENDFDYVFQKMLVMSVVDWQKHTNAAVRLLKPGGSLEMQDLSWHVYDRNGELIDVRYSHIRAIQSVSLEKGLDPFCGQHLAEYMREAGLPRVSCREYPFAWACWSERPETEFIAAHQQSVR
jgi:ubiquinone/menaquinone biosynthesis C-methylase UbiE